MPIVSATGVRREESAARQRMPVSAPKAKLERKNVPGLSWNPIIEWKAGDVMAMIQRHNLALHEAYTLYGTSRISCAYCIMSSEADLLAASIRTKKAHSTTVTGLSGRRIAPVLTVAG
ncbi:phosphoadenosine phosphosulfate reductase family protein [Burkholderia sp. Ac-20345]|uniref:phosphoadenosine phosphosulfate reductase domain-containing protein n=1 Tax=Burkholderia sp. Ac-20345 TaxID=2703891 RepID=UPI001F11D842|nr:phosphoadenosine phosphosulfate reductase family protein [Burkholderia sp. Ac-20345]